MADAEKSERDYIRGSAAAYRSMLGECLRNPDQGDRDAHSWKLERADTVAALRRVCEEFGDNEWDDGLHLADVIEKHLARRLHHEAMLRDAESDEQ